MNKLVSFIGLICCCLILSQVNADINIQHVQGSYLVKEIPKKTMTYDMASLDTMNALDIDVLGLPKAFALSHLKKYQGSEYLNIGSLFEPDYEMVAAHQPDLTIVATRSSKSYKGLSELAPTIDLSIDSNHFIDQVKSTSHKIAAIFGKQHLLKAKLTQIDDKLAKTKTLAKTAGSALFILTNGGKVSTYGIGSRFGWIFEELGINPAITNVEAAVHGDPISFEFILETNPDWIFVLDRDAAIGKRNGAAEALLDNELIHKSKAALNNKIVYLNAFNWYILAGGITALDNSIQEVLSALER